MIVRPLTRRAWLAAAVVPLLASGCGRILERPYVSRRDWPLDVPRPAPIPPPAHGPVLLVRTLRAGPGLSDRGLQVLQPDGSVRAEFYEEWVVPPADAVESALRRWLADSGMFAAVTAPGSRLAADFALEGELTTLNADPGRGVARAALAATVLDQRGAGTRMARQIVARTQAPLASADPAAMVAAQLAALAEAFTQVEAGLRAVA
jgi:ABC-type uncharacterized transport system auxiliary subunit